VTRLDLSTDPVRNVLDRLGESVKKLGDCKWQSRCPAHDDRSPSLSVTIGDGGRVLLHLSRRLFR